jgi:hypothetical protein
MLISSYIQVTDAVQLLLEIVYEEEIDHNDPRRALLMNGVCRLSSICNIVKTFPDRSNGPSSSLHSANVSDDSKMCPQCTQQERASYARDRPYF